MPRLEWGAAGARLFEVGVDRGVLYLEGGSGVPWNGLISVSETITGGDAKAYYLDGVKYSNRFGSEEFGATVVAYTYPEEFAVYDGTAEVGNGLFVTQQARKKFSLSYRTLIGNDVSGTNFGYKIHLVYGALAAPSERSYSSLNDSIDPFNFSWSLSTTPSFIEGHKATSHFIIDSRKTPAELLTKIEDILYGTATTAARIPSIYELNYLFTAFESESFDARIVGMPYFSTFDAELPATVSTSTLDGGSA